MERTPGLNSLTLYGPVPMPALKSVVPSLHDVEMEGTQDHRQVGVG